LPAIHRADSSPTLELKQPAQRRAGPNKTEGHASEPAQPAVRDTVVDVLVSFQHHNSDRLTGQSTHNRSRKPNSPLHTNAQMIISIWRVNEGEQYFTLTFTLTTHTARARHSHLLSPTPSSTSPLSPQSPAPSLQLGSPLSSTVSSPSESSTNASPLLTNGAPPRLNPETFTHFQKLTRMKDAMLSNMDIPVVGIWRDESAVFPNRAARKLFAVTADAESEQRYDFLSRFRAYTADFSRELEEDENVMLSLCRMQKTFKNWKIGLIDPTGKPRNFDVCGRPVFDEMTGEFLVGLVSFKDVTEYTQKLATQVEENEQQFQLICDTMPQMLWTTMPDGYHDYFSQRWYDYTGLTPEQSLGMGWQLPFHPDDMPAAVKTWAHSLATGDEYTTEYRCQRADGAWRWMLGRALPLRDVKTGLFPFSVHCCPPSKR
jgi:PAS domain S-box-containing protein